MERYLILKDGSVYCGEAIGASGETIGEAVFTTGMCGYMQTITDPSYYGQIVTQTFPLIGNYGTIPEEEESESPALKGYIVRDLCPHGSNFRKAGELDEYLRKNNIVGIKGVDTRAITRKIRINGVMNAMITDNLKRLPEKLAAVKKYRVREAVENTTCKERKIIGSGDKNVVLYDFGAKLNIERMLVKNGCQVIRVPAHTPASETLALKPDGIMLSNGGGDPADNTRIIEQIKILCEHKIPTFGICLGHQLLALANGFKTIKLKYGHRGANQPVRDTVEGGTYITSQNHGYAVKADSVDEAVATVRYINANDKTVEGLDYKNIPAFSVQFHPEACSGPKDTEFLFERFVKLMEAHNA